jgi:hypothetical protein
VSLFILELPRKKARAVGHYSQAISRTQEQSAKKPDKKRVFFISIVNNRIKQGFQAPLDPPELLGLCYAAKSTFEGDWV